MPTATAASGATSGRKINAAKGLTNDDDNDNENLVSRIIILPVQIIARGELFYIDSGLKK